MQKVLEWHTHSYIQCSVLGKHRHSPPVISVFHIIVVGTIVGLTVVMRSARYWFDLAVHVGQNL